MEQDTQIRPSGETPILSRCNALNQGRTGVPTTILRSDTNILSKYFHLFLSLSLSKKKKSNSCPSWHPEPSTYDRGRVKKGSRECWMCMANNYRAEESQGRKQSVRDQRRHRHDWRFRDRSSWEWWHTIRSVPIKTKSWITDELVQQ